MEGFGLFWTFFARYQKQKGHDDDDQRGVVPRDAHDVVFGVAGLHDQPEPIAFARVELDDRKRVPFQVGALGPLTPPVPPCAC